MLPPVFVEPLGGSRDAFSRSRRRSPSWCAGRVGAIGGQHQRGWENACGEEPPAAAPRGQEADDAGERKPRHEPGQKEKKPQMIKNVCLKHLPRLAAEIEGQPR